MRLRRADGREREPFDPMAYTREKWLAICDNRLSGEIVEITSSRQRFRKVDYDNLIQSMFIEACGGIENRYLVTNVWKDSGRRFCQIAMLTTCNGSNIWADVYVNGEHIRRMVIAE